MRQSRWLVPVSLALVAVAALDCSKKPKDDDESAEPAAAAKTEKTEKAEKTAEPAAAGVGTISGTVAFTGKAPEAAELPRKADPICAAKPMKSNEVIVNSNATLKDVLVRVAPGAVKGKFS